MRAPDRRRQRRGGAGPARALGPRRRGCGAVLAAALLVSWPAAAVAAPHPPAAAGGGDWTPAWGTSFTAAGLPAGCGAYDGADGNGGSAWSRRQVAAGSGDLRITLERRTTNGRAWTAGGVGCVSRPQTYGRYEIRARLPRGAGIVTSVVLQPAHGGERDWSGVELLAPAEGGGARARVTNGSGGGTAADVVPVRDTGTVRDVVLEWRPDGFTVAVDGELLFSGPRSYAGGRWLGIALGTADPSTGAPTATTPVPATLVVESLTVYRYTPGAGRDLTGTTAAERAEEADRALRAAAAPRRSPRPGTAAARASGPSAQSGEGGGPVPRPASAHPFPTGAPGTPADPRSTAAADPAAGTDPPLTLVSAPVRGPASPGVPWTIAAAAAGVVVLTGVVRAAVRRHGPQA